MINKVNILPAKKLGPHILRLLQLAGILVLLSIPKVSFADCGDGELDDCSGDGDCCEEFWVGDGFCDDGSEYETDFDCSAFAYDGGDCSSSSGGSNGTNTFNVHSNEIYLNGSVYHSSDRNKKEGFQTVNTTDILNKLSEMPMTTWRFKTEDSSTVHIGPMAQDFKQAFGFGATDKHIAATDASGVALAAIQELNRTLISVIMKREEALKKMELRLRIAEQRLAEKESLIINSR